LKHISVWLLSVFLTLSLISFAHAEGNTGVPETIRVLLDSRAHRSLLDEPVRQEDLDVIIACGLRSPSAVNAQPWHFTVVKNREIADEIIGFDINGVVIVISVLPGSGLSDLDELVSVFDCGLATQAMYTAAQALGLGANIYWLPAIAHEALVIPDGYRVLMVMIVGHVDMDTVSFATGRNGAEMMVDYIN